MEDAVFRYQVDLVIRLIDTTTGKEVLERQTRLYKNGIFLPVLSKGEGTYVLLNTKRENFLLQVEARGFEEKSQEVRYEALDSRVPVMEVYLIPEETEGMEESLYTLKGCLPGIQAVEGVGLGESHLFMKAFDEGKRLLCLYNPQKRRIKDVFYGIVNSEKKSFEKFQVVKELDESSVLIDHVLEDGWELNAPIARIVFGMVLEGSDFIIRFRKGKSGALYLVKYMADDKVRYEMVDVSAWKGK